MTVRELRRKYLDFFRSKGHQQYPSGSLVPIDVTGKLDESLLFNGAGMVQFKPYFRGVSQPESKRLTTCQKCLRTGDIEEVGDNSHLTFFEMLGNFSFGDYFAEEAIDFSWEFMTSPQWLGLDPNRLATTVFELDEVARARWATHFNSVGIAPESRVFKLGEESNYWPAGAFTNGPPGPCGPNSEMFYWVPSTPAPSGPYTKEQFLADEAEGKWLEFWNDVFIQYEWQGELKNSARPAMGYTKTGMPNLPFRSIDTGMGLERTVVVLSGLSSVYETDAFLPALGELERLASEYGVTVGSPETVRATRIIADHIRSATFCLSDGILASNTGRGYVLRRLIRRAILEGFRRLNLRNHFLAQLSQTVISEFEEAYPELKTHSALIQAQLESEERLFRRTLSDGMSRFQTLVAPLQSGSEPSPSANQISGEDAFKLYDTYGFPLEVTVELAEEQGLEVDVEGYERAMIVAQERSRGSQEKKAVYDGTGENPFAKIAPTRFRGYETGTVEDAKVMGIETDPKEPHTFKIALDQTPFYARSGGQVSDTGQLESANFNGVVTDVQKVGDVYVHTVTGDGAPADAVTALIDESRRNAICRNHTATHLLHAALRETLGHHVTQAGSFVGPENLRFDFTHGKAVTPEELLTIENRVNEHILLNLPVHTYVDLPIAEARAKGAMALFGEKYGDKVRMVEIEPFSRELCGGTHVHGTGAIGLFKIIAESSAASGVRRIEAKTGEGALDYLRQLEDTIRRAAVLLKSPVADVLGGIERQQEAMRELRQKLEKARAQGSAAEEAWEEINGIQVGTVITQGEPSDASATADRLAAADAARVVLVAVVGERQVSFAVKAGSGAIAKGVHAGSTVKAMAQVAGGGGGGNPTFAQAGGRDRDRAPEAVKAGFDAVKLALGS